MGAPRAALATIAMLLAFSVPVSAMHVDADDLRWACGFGRHPNQCGIDPVGGGDPVQSVGDPAFATDWPGDGLPGDARVLGVIHGGEVRAYPVRMLNTHEIVNDIIGETPVAVTFCPLCGSGVTFLRTLDWQSEAAVTNLTASGYLWRTDMVMWDPETNQLWNQITGQPIAVLGPDGPEAGHASLELDFLPTTITTWDNWQSKHPDTTLLQPVFRANSYREDIYQSTRSDNCQHGLSGEDDCDVEGLHPKVQVVGHDDGAGGIAFPIRDVAANGGAAFYETEEGTRFVGVGDVHGDTRIYAAGTHNFTKDASGLWTDEDGGLWDLSRGERLDAPGQLAQVDAIVSFWFAWHDHYPATEVWLPAATPLPPAPEDRKIPGFAAPILLISLLVAGATSRKRS